MNLAVNRRRYERFQMPTPYCTVRVRPLWSPTFTHEGHIYDISESGIRFECDDPIEPGTQVAIEIVLPTPTHPDAADETPGQPVHAFANVIWVNEEDLPGPVRMAAAISRFARTGDRERLMRRLVAGRYARAA